MAARESASPPEHTVSVFLQSFDDRWKNYRKQLRKCRSTCSPEAIHDLRVATRRLLGWIDVVLMTMPDRRLRNVREHLRALFDRLSPLRDVQVQIESVTALLPRYPDMDSYRTVLLVRERRLLKAIGRRVARVETAGMSKLFSSVKRSLRTGLETGAIHQAFFAAFQGAAAGAFTRSVNNLRQVNPARSASIHRLRVAFKKFRYLEEMIGPLIGIGKQQLQAMNAYQLRMGNIQDIEVLIAGITSFAVRRKRKPRPDPLKALRTELIRERVVRIQAFMNAADELLTFWNDGTAGKPTTNPE
jgi:CHAD domain-containing protein